MGFFGLVQNPVVANPSPCHQNVSQEETTEPCETCETALDAWEENVVAASEVELKNAPDGTFGVGSITKYFIFESKPLEDFYQAYYPPPRVLIKAVTPNTKTIVLLS